MDKTSGPCRSRKANVGKYRIRRSTMVGTVSGFSHKFACHYPRLECELIRALVKGDDTSGQCRTKPLFMSIELLWRPFCESYPVMTALRVYVLILTWTLSSVDRPEHTTIRPSPQLASFLEALVGTSAITLTMRGKHIFLPGRRLRQSR